jgi:hypothetical protein
MQIDLLPKQRLAILLPDGSDLILDDSSPVLRLERWRHGRLELFLSLSESPCPSAPAPAPPASTI